MLRGFEMGYVIGPVHRVHMQSELLTGCFSIIVSAELPITGIDFLMGNDTAGGKLIGGPSGSHYILFFHNKGEIIY